MDQLHSSETVGFFDRTRLPTRRRFPVAAGYGFAGLFSAAVWFGVISLVL